MGVLYSSVIRERYRRPRCRGELPDPDAIFEDVNPLCGDRIRITLRLTDGLVAEARHIGDSCAICAASADILAELVAGRPASEAESVSTEDLLRLLEADIRPTRMKCVTLPLQVLRSALSHVGVPS
jgi:nitrogen fixation NifU-like protein